jgi:hypothetical protein
VVLLLVWSDGLREDLAAQIPTTASLLTMHTRMPQRRRDKALIVRGRKHRYRKWRRWRVWTRPRALDDVSLRWNSSVNCGLKDQALCRSDGEHCKAGLPLSCESLRGLVFWWRAAARVRGARPEKPSPNACNMYIVNNYASSTKPAALSVRGWMEMERVATRDCSVRYRESVQHA